MNESRLTHHLMLLPQLFSRKRWWTTLLVLAAIGVMIRLGIWQLDRLEQRRIFNAHVLSVQAMPPLALAADTLTEPLETMEYRQVTATGEYDVTHQVALRNRVWYGKPGYELLTPLKINGTDQAVLVNRGWIPAADFTPDGEHYPQPGMVTVTGIIRLSRAAPDFGGRGDPTPQAGQTLSVWNLANVAAIASQIPYPLLPTIYIQRAPDASLPPDVNAWTGAHLPYPGLPEIEITEGPHMGYALQWLTFAAILAIGYPIFISRAKDDRSH